MIRKLLASTAVLAFLTTGAIAAQHNVPKMPDTTTDQSTGATPTPAPTPDATTGDTAETPMKNETGFVSASKDQILVTTLIGKTVYSGPGPDAEVIGDINDLVMSQTGAAEAVVVGVGGFLGMGEKNVAVPFDRLQWTESEGDLRLTLTATRQELEAAPEFDTSGMVGEAEPEAPATQQ